MNCTLSQYLEELYIDKELTVTIDFHTERCDFEWYSDGERYGFMMPLSWIAEGVEIMDKLDAIHARLIKGVPIDECDTLLNEFHELYDELEDNHQWRQWIANDDKDMLLSEEK